MNLKKISFDKSFHYSPWPGRLLGFKEWHKQRRNTQDILKEYNDGWYSKALCLWCSNYSKSKNPLQFFKELDSIILKIIMDTPNIYETYEDQHLISIQKDLYLANWSVINCLYENLVETILSSYIKKFNITTIVELGCGTGVNLFKLNYKTSVKKIIGGDICSNAVELGNSIADQCSINAKFKIFDYFDADSVSEMVSEIDEPYLIFTSHSIEQIQVGQTSLINQIINLKNKPEVVVHLEPVLNAKNTDFFSSLCKIYAEKNLYNLDLLQELYKEKQNNNIEIIDYQEDVMGISAFNPTSVICWAVRC